MLYRYEYVREDASLTANDVYRIDLPKQGYLSSLVLRISGTQSADMGVGGGAWRLIDFINKITVLANGSEIIKSLDSFEIDALAFYDERVMPPDTWRNYATNTQFAYLLINFGRFKGDPYIGLDLSRYSNVEFQFSNNVASAEFSSMALSILGMYIADPAPNQFVGHLRTEEWRQWTTVADETKYHELDLEYKIRRIMLRAVPSVDANNVASTGLANLMESIKLSLDTGKFVLYDGGIDDLIRCNYYNYGNPVITGGFPYHTADKGIRMDVGYATFAVAGAGSQDGAGAATIPTIESGRTDFTQKPETKEADNPMSLVVHGVSPFNTAMFRFDYDDEPSKYLDPMSRRQVLLNIKTRNAASAAGGKNYVVLDRFVPYRVGV